MKENNNNMEEGKDKVKEHKILHPILGAFIGEELRRAHLNILEMCRVIDMGPNTYELLKKGPINV